MGDKLKIMKVRGESDRWGPPGWVWIIAHISPLNQNM